MRNRCSCAKALSLLASWLLLMLPSQEPLAEAQPMHRGHDCEELCDVNAPCVPVKVPFFAWRHEDEVRLKNCAARVEESMRAELIKLAARVDTMISTLDAVGELLPSLRDIHQQETAVLARIPSCWQQNTDSILRLLRPFTFIYGISDAPHASNSMTPMSRRNVASYDSVSQLLAHLARDYGHQGSGIRKSLYGEILASYERFVSDAWNQPTLPKCVVPGAGTGRLALELAAAGATVEVNDCSYMMQAALQAIVNDLLVKKTTVDIYPLLHIPFADEVDTVNRVTAVRIPDENSWHLANARHRLSSQLGDFVEIYSNTLYSRTCDVVVTCFFIDTAEQIFDYISVISHMLKSGGVWINSGPLHYHSNSTIRYSLRTLTSVLECVGFEIVHTSTSIMSYTGEETTVLKPEVYNVAHFVAVLTETSKGVTLEQALKLKEKIEQSWGGPSDRNSKTLWPRGDFVML